MLYSLDEICLFPAQNTKIRHRSDITVFTNKNKYPIFTAPMHCIVNENNIKTLDKERLNVIVPRTVAWKTRLEYIKEGYWVAVGFKEAEYIFTALLSGHITASASNKIRICIDQANGHMCSLLELCKKIKSNFGNCVKIMTGNIANPATYTDYAAAGIDYVRVGVGGGNACTTSVQTGMHYPMGSLIIGCAKMKQHVKAMYESSHNTVFLSVPKIVADGGFKRIDQCVKALALGADYIMLGEILAKSFEACGETYYKDNNGNYTPEELNPEDFHDNYRIYFGMSTEEAQRLVNRASLYPINNFVPKHTEGQSKMVPVEYFVHDWLSDFNHALKSSMSYANARYLDEFIGNVKWDYMTVTTYNAYMK